MPAVPPTDIPVPPGEYQFPGLGGRLLVIAGPASIKAPSGPIDLLSLLAGQAAPVPPAGPDPVPTAGPKQSTWITILLAILGLLAGTQLPGLIPARPDPAPIPAPPEPARPTPTPTPPAPPQPPAPAPRPGGSARPDWLPEAPPPFPLPSPQAPADWTRQAPMPYASP